MTRTLEEALTRHQIRSNDVAERLLKAGKDETSALIEYRAIMVGDETTFETTITLLPIRRKYKAGSKIIDDDQLMFEQEVLGLE